MRAAIDKVADLFGLPNAIWEVPPPMPISMIDVQLLDIPCPFLPAAEREHVAAALRAASVRFEINTVWRVAAFLGQLSVESRFRLKPENLNYTAARMAEVWPSRFSVTGKKGDRPNAKAMALAGNPEAPANEVYANPLGNRPPESGDGWQYRGDWLIRLTGKANWTRFAKAIGKSVDEAQAWVRGTIEAAVMSVACFWEENDINLLADMPAVADETKAINGADLGLAEREAGFDRIVAELLRRGA